MKRLFIWHNLNNDTYYHKFNWGSYKNWKLGDINAYNHQLFYVVDDDIFSTNIRKPSLKKRLIKRLIRFLENKLRK